MKRHPVVLVTLFCIAAASWTHWETATDAPTDASRIVMSSQDDSWAGSPAPVTWSGTAQVNDAGVGQYRDEHRVWLPIVAKSESGAWPMAGANLERTSRSSEQVRGRLHPIWYRPIEPYIPDRVQIIAENGLLYISTAKGLYALDAQTGGLAWVYPTELPLGHSPTIYGSVAYVGGFDKKLHAVNALTGQGIWTFEAEAGFQTNPLVVNLGGQTYIFAGNRDGNMYALQDLGSRAQLAWRYPTGGPVLFSAAYKDHTIYFASNDAYAYALDAQTGALVWKSAKILGEGFHSFWPVIYQDQGVDVVIFTTNGRYRRGLAPGPGLDLVELDRDYIFPNHLTAPKGEPVGPRTGDGWIDASRIAQYFEEKPWRRTYFVLNRATGQQVTFDLDHDGRPDYAPILGQGTKSGNRFPPIVGRDNILYQTNTYMSAPWIVGSHVSGWRFGTALISTPSAQWLPADEPAAYSAGGNVVYWSYWMGSAAGAFDISIPNTRFWDNGAPGGPDPGREWVYFDYNLEDLAPVWRAREEMWQTRNMMYNSSGDMNPPIPYRGRVYLHVANSVIAFGPQADSPQRLPTAASLPTSDDIPIPDAARLRDLLAQQVTQILDAGHLRPGYMTSGLFDGAARHQCGDNLADYWHNPSDTLYTLMRSLPYLREDLQQRTRSYLQSEFAAYPPYGAIHVGWRDGANRDDFIYPPDIANDFANYPPTIWSSYDFEPWGGTDLNAKFPPHMFYALWKYAQVFGGARQIFDNSRALLEPAPSDATLARYPFVHNAYLSGYWGYLELEKLAGYSESSHVRSELNRLLNLRAVNFTKDRPDDIELDCQALNIARNFIFLVPESGQYLREHALPAVRAAVDEYTTFTPYWFVSRFEATGTEGTLQPLYDYNAIFQAKALILGESLQELAKYLDVPAFPRGDLSYIQNLVTTLEAATR